MLDKAMRYHDRGAITSQGYQLWALRAPKAIRVIPDRS
jgi:hypothetical protein